MNIGSFAGKVSGGIVTGSKAAASAITGFGAGAIKTMDKVGVEAGDTALSKMGSIVSDTALSTSAKQRIAKGIGGGIEGAIAGAGVGTVAGGISGAIDEDESVIGGALKGGLIGGLAGGTIGGVSASIHNNAGIAANMKNDYTKVARKISKFGSQTADGNANKAADIATAQATMNKPVSDELLSNLTNATEPRLT